MPKRTTLYEKHLAAGGKMVEFAGYDMPVQYPLGVIGEHMAVRSAAGLFDVSHMGEVVISGAGAMAALQTLLTNDMEGLAQGACRYSPMCNEEGGVVDDLIVYRLGQEKFLLVVNASNREKDVAWMKKWLPEEAVLEDISDDVAELALQGPKAEEILAAVTKGGKAALPGKNYTFLEGVEVAKVQCLVSRTGYTGEDGFEIYCKAAAAPAVWDAVMEAGKGAGLVPCGLGARDTLRLEAGMPLYGHEMDEAITPYEAGLGMFVKPDAKNFTGKAALVGKNPPARRRTAIKVTGRGIAREGCEVYRNGEKVGVVTSGTQLPFVGWPGAMALLDMDAREEGTVLEVDVRGRMVAAEVVKAPFYKRDK
ncbi:glycine cleavage system aminomethyltransferase GcvT [Ruminococcaceae bacterium OttesenSCG-928-O06]|nr:glycine cleavage system aminomethyltransferase GcvT [Ruminococcaceae bacterium OttesenSCG-928-O06]